MKNKVIIITGGASGIGLATAKKLSKENKIIIADYKNIEQDFLKNNFENTENIYFFKCDISKEDNILNLKKYVVDNFKKLDSLVCCAGIMPLPCSIDTIADSVIFLLSDKSSYITGQVLIVDGGFTLKWKGSKYE